MPITLIQEHLGNWFGGNLAAPGGTVNSGTGYNFTSNTTAGSLLVAIVFVLNGGTGCKQPTASAPSTPGLSWTQVASVNSSGFNTLTPYYETLAMYYCANAPSISTGTQTTFSGTVSGTTQLTGFNGEIYLFEFGGIAATSPLDAFATNSGSMAVIPFTANLTTSQTDLIFATFLSYTGPGHINPGTGYTIYTPAMAQYILNQPAGSIATAFGSGTTASQAAQQWGCIAAAFKSATVPPTVTSVILSSGSTSGNQGVTITGTNFAGSPTVTFGGVNASNIILVNSTTITCDTPAHAAGSVTVAVTTTGGTASLPNGFTYIQLVVPETALLINRVWGFSPACGDSTDCPEIQNLSVTCSGSWSVVSNQNWLSVVQVNSTTAQISIYNPPFGTPTLPQGNGKSSVTGLYSAGGVTQGQYTATLTFTSGTVQAQCAVTYSVGYGTGN
jgi:IPT/TIG domain